MIRCTSVVLIGVLAQSAAMGQPATTEGSGEWRTYNHDLAGTRFSPLGSALSSMSP